MFVKSTQSHTTLPPHGTSTQAIALFELIWLEYILLYKQFLQNTKTSSQLGRKEKQQQIDAVDTKLPMWSSHFSPFKWMFWHYIKERKKETVLWKSDGNFFLSHSFFNLTQQLICLAQKWICFKKYYRFHNDSGIALIVIMSMTSLYNSLVPKELFPTTDSPLRSLTGSVNWTRLYIELWVSPVQKYTGLGPNPRVSELVSPSFLCCFSYPSVYLRGGVYIIYIQVFLNP